MFPKARVFVPVKPFQPSVMFARKAGVYPKHLSFSPLWGRLLALLTNIRLF